MNCTVEDLVRCTLCGTDGPKEDAKFFPLYVIGSEGVIACMECRMALTDCAKHLMRVAGKCRMVGYKACKQVHVAVRREMPTAEGATKGEEA